MATSFTPPNYGELQKRMKGEGNSSYWGGYFKNGIYGGTPSKNKSFSGRILPMFDYIGTSKADPDFAKSWSPYRDKGSINQETGQPDLVAFFGIGLSYTWFGNKQVSFLSPHTLKYTHGFEKRNEMIDPLSDIHRFAKRHEDPAIRALTEREENKKDAKMVIPYPQLRYFFNFYGTSGSDRTMKNYVIDFSPKGFADLCAKLAEWRPAHERVLDNDWPDYLFGDITNPDTGLLIDTVSLPASPQPFNGMIFTAGSHKSSKGVQSRAVPEEALVKRAHFYGDDMAFKILSAQEIVDFLVDDGSVPYHLIQEVCSNYANVPPEPHKVKVFAGNPDADAGDEEVYVPKRPAYAGPTMPVKSAPAPAAPAAPVITADTFWVSVMGSKPEKYSGGELQALVDKGQDGIKVCKVGDKQWKLPGDLGFFRAELPDDLPPLEDEAPPFESSAPALIDEAPPWSAPEVTPSAPPAVKAKSVEAKDNQLTEEEKDELAQLELDFARDGVNMGPDKLSRIIYLRPKAGHTSILP